jgi:hypothetical protein
MQVAPSPETSAEKKASPPEKTDEVTPATWVTKIKTT